MRRNVSSLIADFQLKNLVENNLEFKVKINKNTKNFNCNTIQRKTHFRVELFDQNHINYIILNQNMITNSVKTLLISVRDTVLCCVRK